MKKFIVAVFGEARLLRIRDSLETVDYHLLKVIRHSRLLTSLYSLGSGKFRREAHAVVNGRYTYENAVRRREGSSNAFLVRRNIHRIEKGLIMRPMRGTFALEYIGETLTAFQALMEQDVRDVTQLEWAYSVLVEFFDATAASDKLNSHRDVFTRMCCAYEPILSEFQNPQSIPSVPRARNLYPDAGISTTQLEILFQQRRAVRWYTDEPVVRDQIEKAAELASLAPSACNRQPFEFYFVSNSPLAAEIATIAMGTKGFGEHINNLIVIVGDLSAYPAERDRHLIYIDGGLAAMQFMLALETMGLASCPLNWPDVEKLECAMDKKLDLPPHKRPVMLISVGHPDPQGGVPYSQKKNIIRSLNDPDS